jgi:hypothetical protein
MLRLLALLAGLAVAGCSPGSLEELRVHADERFYLDLEQGYQQTYRNILSAARRCWPPAGRSGPQFVVDGNVDEFNERGRVTVRYTSVPQQVLMNMDIDKIEGGSRVSVISHPPVRRSPGTVLAWATEATTQCY